jgi:hypothetical protein
METLVTQTAKQHYDSTQRWRAKNPILCMLQRARQNAKRKGLPYSIKAKSIMIPECCPILGIRLKRAKGHFDDASPSLDKKIPKLGYVEGNVQVISAKANVMKNNASPDELRRFAAWIRSVYGD